MRWTALAYTIGALSVATTLFLFVLVLGGRVAQVTIWPNRGRLHEVKA